MVKLPEDKDMQSLYNYFGSFAALQADRAGHFASPDSSGVVFVGSLMEDEFCTRTATSRILCRLFRLHFVFFFKIMLMLFCPAYLLDGQRRIFPPRNFGDLK